MHSQMRTLKQVNTEMRGCRFSPRADIQRDHRGISGFADISCDTHVEHHRVTQRAEKSGWLNDGTSVRLRIEFDRD